MRRDVLLDVEHGALVVVDFNESLHREHEVGVAPIVDV